MFTGTMAEGAATAHEGEEEEEEEDDDEEQEQEEDFEAVGNLGTACVTLVCANKAHVMQDQMSTSNKTRIIKPDTHNTCPSQVTPSSPLEETLYTKTTHRTTGKNMAKL
jgi:hypothetical protein